MYAFELHSSAIRSAIRSFAHPFGNLRTGSNGQIVEGTETDHVQALLMLCSGKVMMRNEQRSPTMETTSPPNRN
jgi:hypothetical protein